MKMTTERENRAKLFIKFFNLTANGHFWFGPEKNQRAVNAALDACADNMMELKTFAREAVKAGNTDLISVCNDFVEKKHGEAKEVPVEPVPPVEPAVEPEKVEAKPVQPAQDQTTATLTASLDFMSQLIVKMLAETKSEEIKAAIGSSIREDVKQYIADNYGPIKRKVEFELPERKVQFEGVVHAKFDAVLKFVQADEPVFLTGPAGSGKNVLCQQVAQALGLDFYFTNAVTQEYKLTGFTDAMGTFHESQFFKAFKNGGLFMLDEMDASIPEVLIILNAAIANRYFDFPAPIGYVKAHPNFRVVAAGNTFGNGADYDYVGRNQLDAASLDRFAQVKIDYDEKIEESCANGDMELLNFCRKFRDATRKAGIRAVVSYRAISRMAKLSKAMDKAELLESCLVKSLQFDDLNSIKDSLSGCGQYSAAFAKVMSSRKNEGGF